MVKLHLTALLSLFSAVSQAEAVIPSAGSIVQQIQSMQSHEDDHNNKGVAIEQKVNSKPPKTMPFMVKSFHISGNEKIDTNTLHQLIAEAEGKKLTLSDLNDLAARLTDYYHNHNYPLAHAIIPPQTIQSGMVHINIIEARYGKIELINHSRVNDALLKNILSPLQGDNAIEQSSMDSALLYLSDTPGVVVDATLKPGNTKGTSDLLINTAPTNAISGNLLIDDYGNKYTGKPRISGTINLNNPLHHGDTLSLSSLSSGGGMNYERIAYDSLLSAHGDRVGGSYTFL